MADPVNRARPSADWRSNVRASLDPHESDSPAPHHFAPPLDHVLTPAAPPLLDDKPETDQGFRHSGWRHQRHRVYAAFTALGETGRRRERFAACGSNAWVMRSEEDRPRYRLAADYCHDRWCQPCAVARSRLIAANLRPVIQDVPHRFITLTLRSEGEPLATLLRKLYRSFARLRRSKLWASTIKGGVAICEITYNQDKQLWHPHLHVIATGKFLPQAQLSATWLKLTGNSPVVDIRLIRGHEQCVGYICKYASKPINPTFAHDHDRLCEAILALRGRKLALTFGSWRGIRLTEVHDETTWTPFQPLQTVRDHALRGDQEARRILALCLGMDAWLLIPPPEPDLWDQ